MNVLEVLYAARDSLNHRKPEEVVKSRDFVFEDWNRCTCGHIYAAALGKHPKAVAKLSVAHDGVTALSYDAHNGDKIDAALGRSVTKAKRELYLAALQAVVDANKLEKKLKEAGHHVDQMPLHHLVSDGTVALSRRWYQRGPIGEIQRLRTARRMISNAIRYVERQQERDRQAVAARAA
jgi:hypothetical protein